MSKRYGLCDKFRFFRRKLHRHQNFFNRKNEVSLLTGLFFDARGERVIFGGAERYIINLGELLENEFGKSLTVYQRGATYEPWVRQYQNITVIGLPVGGKYKFLNHVFHRLVAPADLTIYNQLDLAIPYCHNPAIAISHGIYWDSPQAGEAKKRRMIKHYIAGLRNVNTLISVDTTTLHFFRGTIDCRFVNGKSHYVPNFVDTEIFHPSKDLSTSSGLTITYPRRLYEARGFFLMAEAMDLLLDRYTDITLCFAGEIDNEKVRRELDRLISSYPGRISYCLTDFDDMATVYRTSDVVVIPTLYSEGTSLSLLEAMASGCCVVATDVGGLTDLVIDNYNGVLCEPTVTSLTEALAEVIEDTEKRARLAACARETAVASFGKQRWQQKWRDILKAHLDV